MRCSNRQVLTRLELKLIAEVVGNVESDFDAVAGQGSTLLTEIGWLLAWRAAEETRHADRQQCSQFAVEAFPLVVLRGVELLPKDGADCGIALKVGGLVASPGRDIAVEGDRGVQVVDQVVVLR